MNRKTTLIISLLIIGLNGYGQKSLTNIIRIGLYTDIQYYDGPAAGSRHYRQSLEKIPKMLKHLNTEDLDFLVELGDRIDRDYKSFKPVEALLSESRHPIIFVPGNHDYSVSSFNKIRVTAKSGHSKAYHSQTIGKWHLVFLNGLDNSIVAHSWYSLKYWKAKRKLETLKAQNAPNAYDWNGGLGEKQIAWLKTQMEIASTKKMNLIVFCHQPLFPGNAHNLWGYEYMLQLLSDHPGEAWWISGHDHRGGYQEVNGVHLLTLRGMVEGLELSYGILELHEDQVDLIGYGGQANLDELRK
ncbi:MAG: metallophosphoesterase [Bacteroidales bacterium]|nr:metallophosphoesterase [Bacteroidales bacterium]